jgi:hypothetical protein
MVEVVDFSSLFAGDAFRVVCVVCLELCLLCERLGEKPGDREIEGESVRVVCCSID